MGHAGGLKRLWVEGCHDFILKQNMQFRWGASGVLLLEQLKIENCFIEQDLIQNGSIFHSATRTAYTQFAISHFLFANTNAKVRCSRLDARQLKHYSG